MMNDLSVLSQSDAEKPGELNFREGPTMLLKIKENRSDILDGPTMLMKTSNLSFGATMFLKRNALSRK